MKELLRRAEKALAAATEVQEKKRLFSFAIKQSASSTEVWLNRTAVVIFSKKEPESYDVWVSPGDETSERVKSGRIQIKTPGFESLLSDANKISKSAEKRVIPDLPDSEFEDTGLIWWLREKIWESKKFQDIYRRRLRTVVHQKAAGRKPLR